MRRLVEPVQINVSPTPNDAWGYITRVDIADDPLQFESFGWRKLSTRFKHLSVLLNRQHRISPIRPMSADVEILYGDPEKVGEPFVMRIRGLLRIQLEGYSRSHLNSAVMPLSGKARRV